MFLHFIKCKKFWRKMVFSDLAYLMRDYNILVNLFVGIIFPESITYKIRLNYRMV